MLGSYAAGNYKCDCNTAYLWRDWYSTLTLLSRILDGVASESCNCQYGFRRRNDIDRLKGTENGRAVSETKYNISHTLARFATLNFLLVQSLKKATLMRRHVSTLSPTESLSKDLYVCDFNLLDNILSIFLIVIKTALGKKWYVLIPTAG